MKPTPRIRRLVLLAVLIALCGGVSLWLWPRERITIGVEGRRMVELAGERLTAVPYTHGDPLAVRIAAVEAIRGGFRYDLRYMAYGPGQFDLCDYLVNSQNQSPQQIAKLSVTIPALLDENESGKLFDTAATPIDLHTNYRMGMVLLWALWGALLFPLLLWGRKVRSYAKTPAPPTVPERLRSLLQLAAHSPLTVEQQADVEKLLLAYWADRLNIARDRIAETLHELRSDPSAGAQIGRVERWLHSRSASPSDVVVNELLADLGWGQANRDQK